MSPSKSGAELLHAIDRVVHKIGTPDGYNGTKVPRINNEQSAAVLEYAVAKQIKSVAEAREKAARELIISLFDDDITTAGETHKRMNVHQSPYATLDVHIINGQTRLDRDTLIREMCKKFGIGPDEARTFVDMCSKRGEPQIRLMPTVVSTGE